MAVQVPPEVNWLLDILAGQSWPEGDEDALRRCAQAWQEAAQGLGDLAGYLDSSAQKVLANADSMSADDYDNFWKTYKHGGDGTYIALFKQCEPLVKQLFAQATEVEYTKIIIVVTLILTAIQIAIAIAAAAGTFGGSLAEIPLALFVGRQAIVMVVARFVEMALMMLIPDLVAQTVMLAQGHGWDWSKTGGAFENALVAGSIAAVLGPLAGKLPWMSEEAAQTIGGKLGALATHFVEGGAVNDLTSLATMGANYGLASITGNKDWQQQIGQQFSSTNWLGQFAQGGVMADAFYAAHMFGHDGVPMTFTGSDGKTYTVYLNDAAFASLRDNGQLPDGYQARVFGDNGVQVGDATINGTAISFDKPINGQSGAGLGDGFTVAGHDGSQFRFQPSDQTGTDGQPTYDLVSRVQRSADPITMPNADPGGDPLEFPPGSVVHYDNEPGTMTGQPYRVEVTEGNVVKIYQAQEPGGPFELTGQVVHSSGILRFFGADAPKYYGADGPGDGAGPLATVSLITGRSTTNDLPGYLDAHMDRWAPGQEAGQAAAADLADASSFVYAQQVQQILQTHPEWLAGLPDLFERGGQPPSPAGEPDEWPQFYRTGNHEIPVPRELADLAETDVATRLAGNRQAYELERTAREDQYRQAVKELEDTLTSPHTLRQLDAERQARTAEYQRDLSEMAARYEERDRGILSEELTQMRRFRLARPQARINGALDGLHSQYEAQLEEIDTQLADELAVRRHMDLDRLYVPELERLDAEWARAEALPGPERLERFAELSRQLRDLEVGLYRQHEALRIGPQASEARRWVRDMLSRALKDSKVNAQPDAARQKVIDDIKVRVERLRQQAARTPADRQAPLTAEAAELSKIAAELSGGRGAAEPGPLHPVTRWPLTRVEADAAVADAVDHVLEELPPEGSGGGSRVHAAYELVGFGVDNPGPISINSGRAVPGEPSRWVDNAAGGLLNYLQMRAGTPGELRVGSLADRRTDAEFQIVAQVRARLQALREDPAQPVEPVGVVVIGADKLMCPSCQMALHDLMGEFPGVQVVLASGTVTVILDPALADARPLSELYGPAYDLRADVVPLDASAMVSMGHAPKFFEPASERTDVPPELDLGAFAHPDYEMIIKIREALAERAQATGRTQAIVLDDTGQPHWVQGGPYGFSSTPGEILASADGVPEADYARPVVVASPPDLHTALDGPGDQAALSDLAAQLRARAAATGRVQAIVRDETGELQWVEGGRMGILSLPEPGLAPGLLADDPRQRIVVQTEWTAVNPQEIARQFPPEQFNERLVIRPGGDAIRLTPVARDEAEAGRDDAVSRSIVEVLNQPHAEVPDGFSRVDLPARLERLDGLVYKMPDRVAGYAGFDQKMIELVRQVPGVRGAFLFDMHGDAAGPWDPSNPRSRLDWSEVRDLLTASGWDGKQPVVLMSCDTAQGSFAADLAAKLGTRVIAPTARVWQIGDRVFIFEVDPKTLQPDWSKPGHWEEFGGENPGPVAADEHGMPVLDAPHPKAPEADAQQAANALRMLSDPRAHAPPVPRGQDEQPGSDELPRVTNAPGLVSATGEVVLTSAIDGTRPWVLEVGGHSAGPVDVGPSDVAWPNVFSYGDAQVRLDLVRWPGRMDAVVVQNAADIAERIDLLGAALRPGGLLVLDHGDPRALADERSPLSIWVRASGMDVPEGYERVFSGPDRIVLRKLGGGDTGEQPPAAPDIGRLIAAIASKQAGMPSLFPAPREIEERWGITQRNQKLIQWIVDKEDALLLVRPGNSDSAPMQEAGGLTKPPALKANTISEIDVMLGARDLVGAVGFYPPELKFAEAARAQLEQAGLWDAVRSRFDRRVEQYRPYNDLWPKIEHLILERKFRVVDGVIYPFDPVPVLHEGGIYSTLRVGEPELDDHGRLVAPVFADGEARLAPVNLWPKFNRALGVPVTGDYDVYHALDATGEELPFERPEVPPGEAEPGLWFKKLVDEGFMTQDQIRGKGADAGELLARQMGIQHGAMLVYLRHNEVTDWERQNIYEPIIKGHQVGGTPLLLFQAGRRPTLVYPEPVPAELSRSPILDALNPPGGHHNWLAAVHGPDLLPAHLAIEPGDVPADLTPMTPPTGLGDLAGMVYARHDGNGVVISSDPEHLAAAGAEDDAFGLYAIGGGGQAWAPGGRDLSPEELFALAKQAGWDGTRPLDLVVCQGGAGDKASLAARVLAVARAEFPDAVVRGASDWVWQDPDTGERVVAPGLWSPERGLFLPHPELRGTWHRFPPDDSITGAPHGHQPAAHWVHWADSTTPHRRDWPADPVTGAPLTHHDLDFLGLTEQQVEWWRSGDAPLGMTPDTYHAWIKDLRDALREDGIPPETADVRLLGSSARGFSGPHKRLLSDSEITERYPPAVARVALERKAQWLGEDTQRLQSRPFDAMSKLGLDEPSDYDTNISCDLMVAKARSQWEADGEPVAFLSGDHEYVNKVVAGETFPHLQDWADRWSALLGRDVSWAVFPSTGPKDVSASGHFVHFQDDDWIVMTPGGSQDADD